MTIDPSAVTSLAHASRLIRERRLSAVDLTQSCLDTIHRLPQLGAFVTLLEEDALACAKTADRDIRLGDWRGPLHGMPLGIKDLIDMAGVPTLAQSRQLRGYLPKRNAWAVDRLVDAGAIVLGKLTTHEFAFGPPVFGECGPAACNPWNPQHFAGGSSSGAAVAVASGMLLGALGSDTAGSSRPDHALTAKAHCPWQTALIRWGRWRAMLKIVR
jgi:aspartyl-tRNA(Asn)/glutamyl-tRNA(Gln) amidotransferase subunit A